MRRKSVGDIILNVTSKVVFLFLAICGFMFYVEYEWMMK